MAKPPIDAGQTRSGRITKPKLPSYFRLALTLLPILAGVLAFMAMLGLQSETSIAGVAKAGFVALASGLVSYCINRFAIDWGAELTANGFITAGVFSVSSILTVGACLWVFTYAGMTLPDVRQLELEDHGGNLTRYVDVRNSRAIKTASLAPSVKTAESDLSFHSLCEPKNSCVSGRGNGGRGAVSRILEERAARAAQISEQIDTGLEERDELLAQINTLLGTYQQVLGDKDKSIPEQRRDLIAIDARIEQALAKLDQAVPHGLITAYADELKRGITIPNRPQSTGAVNALLAKHGLAIGAELKDLEFVEIERPVFPARTGIADTFAYLGHFAAIAGVIWVAEGIFPLALWLYTLLFLIRHRQWDSDSAPQVDKTKSSVDHANITALNGSSTHRAPGSRRSRRHNGAGASSNNEPGRGDA